MSSGIGSLKRITQKRNYSVQRSPTLNTVLMVEETLNKLGEVTSVRQLRKKLPKLVMHQTLMQIIDYLEYSGKLVFHDGHILWTYNPTSKLKKGQGLKVR